MMLLSTLILLLLVASNCLLVGQTCEIPEDDRLYILSKIKTQIVDALGPPPPVSTLSSPIPSPSSWPALKSEQRTIRKRHSKRQSAGLEDSSQVILFPSSDVLCETPNLDTSHEELGNSFTYIFRPSPHILSRKVLSVQLWFYTGNSQTHPPKLLQDTPKNEPTLLHSLSSAQVDDHKPQPPTDGPVTQHQVDNFPASSFNISGNYDILQHLVDLQVLSEHKAITVATSRVERVDDWIVFHLAPAFLSYVTRGLFVMLVNCPTCPCTNEPEYTPFLMYTTQPSHRSRRSKVPWSPSALELLQRPAGSGIESAHCHRGSLNISFEELGWDQWIVHPGSFQFHYCHGTCSPSHGLSQALHWGHCCAALPSTMKSLWVTTTTDGGFSYRYETVPNLLTQDCACS
ncbi:inhibin alpha chain [Pelobates cultripes]|uniref:Inhibin alpha chain n=1 Tax=Pelobates cultripes TaxID=61616 RepID=A0AAD1SLB1_PELCU|nr:inhibin alpha chain [Pelobates cultripes]